MKCLVIGAGVIGAAAAHALAARGADVTVVARRPGGEATPGSFGWINASAPCEPAYSQLRLASIAHWRDLIARHPGLPVRMSGGLAWDHDDLDAAAEEYAARGYPGRIIGANEIARLEPALAQIPDRAFLAEAEGVADPAGLAAAFFREAGVTPQVADVTALRLRGSRVTGAETSLGPIEADAVLLAAGVGSLDLLEGVGVSIPVKPVPGQLTCTAPLPRLTQRILLTPGAHLWQRADGRVLAGFDYTGSAPDESDAISARIRTSIAALFGLADVAEEARSSAARPMPVDDRPITGPVAGLDGLTVAVTHSGVTLAPILAELLAGEILDGEPAEALAPFRLSRFDA